jgi:hypothetical protein
LHSSFVSVQPRDLVVFERLEPKNKSAMKGESHKMAKIRSSIRLKDTEQRPTDQSHAIEELPKVGWKVFGSSTPPRYLSVQPGDMSGSLRPLTNGIRRRKNGMSYTHTAC